MAASSCKPAWGEQKFSFEKKPNTLLLLILLLTKTVVLCNGCVALVYFDLMHCFIILYVCDGCVCLPEPRSDWMNQVTGYSDRCPWSRHFHTDLCRSVLVSSQQSVQLPNRNICNSQCENTVTPHLTISQRHMQDHRCWDIHPHFLKLVSVQKWNYLLNQLSKYFSYWFIAGFESININEVSFKLSFELMVKENTSLTPYLSALFCFQNWKKVIW